MSGGKLFPHIKGKASYSDEDLGIGKSSKRAKIMSPDRAELIEKAKTKAEEDITLKKTARAIRKNLNKPTNRKSMDEKNKDAMDNGPQYRKQFHLKDLKEVVPLTNHQAEAFDKWEDDNKNLLLTGCAGTGKTYLGIYLGLVDLLDQEVNVHKMIIIRSAVPARDMGFLPGTEDEKTAVYEQPYAAILNELFPYKNAYENMKEQGLIEFMTTSYLRGLTFNNAIVIVDEIQNMRFSEIHTIMTRMGKHSKIIMCGDYYQNDLTQKVNDQTGIKDLMELVGFGYLPSIAKIDFDERDIVRSGLVREWILACNKNNLQEILSTGK